MATNLQGFFNEKPVFSPDEFAAFFDSKEPRSLRTKEALLAYYARKGRLLHVKRGLYAVVPSGANLKTFSVDPFLLAAKMTPDAVLAYHTALEFYGKAHSVRESFYYLTNTFPRPLTFRGYRFRGVRFPKKLGDEKRLFGVNAEERSGVSMRVTSLERTLVDVLDRPDLSGGWEEVWRSLESVEFFNLDQVVEYALLLKNSTTAAKVGFFLDQHRDALMVNDSYLDTLRGLRPQKPHYMMRTSRKPGRLVSNWNLVVPVEILNRSWQEVP
ncbi:MAG: transcriptional regulator [Thermodesulfobacteriota bacterium]